MGHESDGSPNSDATLLALLGTRWGSSLTMLGRSIAKGHLSVCLSVCLSYL